MSKGLLRCRLFGICFAMISQNRSISNNERPHKAIDYAIPSKKEATFLSDEQPDSVLIEKVIKDTGYDYLGCVSEPYKKRGIFG